MGQYRGFTIQEDNLLGYSLICPKGQWCRSATNIEQLKETVDSILEL